MKPVVLILLAGAMQAASLHGIVRDPQGKPLPGVTIQIRTDATQSSQTAKSGDNGAYRFATLVAGTYFVQVNSHPQIVILHSKDDKELDLVRQGASDTISFSDEPNFVVAGVTDNTYMGSHGSDVKQRSVENLSKATNELKTDVSVQSETSLKAAIEREPSNARLHHALAEAGGAIRQVPRRSPRIPACRGTRRQ